MKNGIIVVFAAIVCIQAYLLVARGTSRGGPGGLSSEASLHMNRELMQKVAASEAALAEESARGLAGQRAIDSQETYKAYYDIAERSQHLAAMQMYKMRVAEFLAMDGRLPVYLSDVSMSISETTTDEQRQVRIEQGRILLLPTKADGGYLALEPKVEAGGNRVTWTCLTNIEMWVDRICEHEEGEALALAPSFDCKNAETPIEKLVCRDDRLMRSDLDLADIYARKRADLSKLEQKQLATMQRRWMASRDTACASTRRRVAAQCIDRWTRERIDTLERGHQWKAPDHAGAGEPIAASAHQDDPGPAKVSEVPVPDSEDSL